MAFPRPILVAYFFLIIYLGSINAAIFIMPGDIVPVGRDLSVLCNTTSQDNFTRVNKIQLIHHLPQLSRIIATVDDSQMTPGGGVVPPRYMISSNFNTSDPGASLLQVSIVNPTCQDDGEYECLVTGVKRDNQPITSKEALNVSVQTNPGTVIMSVMPNKKVYLVEDDVMMECFGEVGNPEKMWSWHWKAPGSSDWSNYPLPIMKGVSDPPKDGRCGHFSTSSIKYVARLKDNGTEIRCSVDGNPAYSAMVTVHTSDPTCIQSEAAICKTSYINAVNTLSRSGSRKPDITDQFCSDVLSYKACYKRNQCHTDEFKNKVDSQLDLLNISCGGSMVTISSLLLMLFLPVMLMTTA